MGIATQYLTSTKNLPEILEAIREAKAPDKFTLTFLEGLGFKSSSDRLIVGVLKALGLLGSEGKPTQRYYEYLDRGESERVLAVGIEEAYEDLYQVNKKAHELTPREIKNKLKTLTQGEFSDDVLTKMASTLKALAKHADFEAAQRTPKEEAAPVQEPERLEEPDRPSRAPLESRFGGLVYNIQIILPESRDQAVYDALFRSMKEHLI